MRGADCALIGVVAVWCTGACGPPPRDPLQLDGNRLTVENRTSQEWHDVDIRLNTYYRVTVRSIAVRERFQVPLDAFVAGYGQRFNFNRAQIHDLRLTAKRPNGETFELIKEFQAGGLAGLLGGKRR